MIKETFNPSLIKNDDETFAYVNKFGKVYRNDFVYATEYKQGFAQVKNKGKQDVKYIDLLGRVTTHKTSSGVMFYRFVAGTLTLEFVPPRCFLDELFCEGIKQELICRLQEKIDEKIKKGERVDQTAINNRLQRIESMVQEKKEQALNIKKV